MHKNEAIKKALTLLLLAAITLPGCGPSQTNQGTADGTDQESVQPGQTDESKENESETEPETEPDSETEPLDDGLEDVDMDGFTLTFLGYDGTQYWWSRNRIDATELLADTVNDAIYNRNRALEERFQAQIQEKQVPSVEESLQRDVLAGITDYQVAMVNDAKINACLTAGVLLMWNDMPVCDLSKPWWNADANNVFQVNGQQFAAVGDFNLSMYSKSYMMYFNKDLYGTLNSVSDLYQTVLDGKWTFETFLSLVEQYAKDLDGNGVYDEKDQYGIVGFLRVMYQQLLTGAGIKYVDINEEGNPYFAIQGNERAISIMQKISESFGNTNAYFKCDESAITMPMVSGGQVVFSAETMYDTEYYRSYEISFGMLPSPKWDESQENYHSITTGGVVSMLPKTLPAEEQEYTGTLMEAMAFASRQETLPAYKETVLKGKYVNDEESAAMVDIIFNTQTYDLGVTIWDVRNQYMSKIFAQNSTDVVSATQAIKNQIDSQIQETIDKINSQNQ